jgi:hypothetical protein
MLAALGFQIVLSSVLIGIIRTWRPSSVLAAGV